MTDARWTFEVFADNPDAEPRDRAHPVLAWTIRYPDGIGWMLRYIAAGAFQEHFVGGTYEDPEAAKAQAMVFLESLSGTD